MCQVLLFPMKIIILNATSNISRAVKAAANKTRQDSGLVQFLILQTKLTNVYIVKGSLVERVNIDLDRCQNLIPLNRYDSHLQPLNTYLHSLGVKCDHCSMLILVHILVYISQRDLLKGQVLSSFIWWTT